MKKLPIAELLCLVGLLVFVMGLVRYAGAGRSPGPAVASSMTERNLAIENAKKSGQKEYSFTTKFIPGIGFITNPDAFAADWQKNVPAKN